MIFSAPKGPKIKKDESALKAVDGTLSIGGECHASVCTRHRTRYGHRGAGPAFSKEKEAIGSRLLAVKDQMRQVCLADFRAKTVSCEAELIGEIVLGVLYGGVADGNGQRDVLSGHGGL